MKCGDSGFRVEGISIVDTAPPAPGTNRRRLARTRELVLGPSGGDASHRESVIVTGETLMFRVSRLRA